jgi:F-type H+-transporting ATPase subunit epsilon
MTMNLEILVPDGVVLDIPIRGLRAADTSGMFGLWPNHEDFATLLVPCVVSYRDEDNHEHYAAVDGGVLVMRSQTEFGNEKRVSISTREAVLADRIEAVADAAAAMLAARREEESTARAEFAELQAALLRELPKAERHT